VQRGIGKLKRSRRRRVYGKEEEEGFKKDLIIHAQLAVARRRRGLAPEIGGGPRSSATAETARH